MRKVKEGDYKHCLTLEEYKVLRERATEPPFSGEYVHKTDKGDYVCKACGNLLFKSNAKFDSGTGWPSFNNAVKGSVLIKKDFSLIIPRDEVVCAKCSSHLGHVFNDGPKPTGKRYCINSLALKYKKN